MLIRDYAPQYGTPCVYIPELDGTELAPQLIKFANEIGAVFQEQPDSMCYVIQFPGRPQELYTENALRRTLGRRP